jgi:hypothetical protein
MFASDRELMIAKSRSTNSIPVGKRNTFAAASPGSAVALSPEFTVEPPTKVLHSTP